MNGPQHPAIASRMNPSQTHGIPTSPPALVGTTVGRDVVAAGRRREVTRARGEK
jgi:hypothetical protein